MATDEVPDELVRLVRKMHDEYTQSELEIALALAEAGGPLSVEKLAEETGYTDRTVKKRTGSLEDNLRGEPLLRRDEEDRPVLHPELVSALQRVEPES